MAKSMYDTGIFQQSWYMNLSPRDKALWWQLYGTKDIAGVVELNLKLIAAMFGDEVTRKEVFTKFGNRIQAVPNHPDKAIFVGYIGWSNPRGLSRVSSSQRGILSRLEELGLSLDALNKMSKRNPVVEVEDDDGDDEELPLDEPTASKKRRASFVKPTLEEVEAYCKERGNSVDPQKWYDYYESNGWLVGRNKMKDWQAAVRTWERNGFSGGIGKGGSSGNHSSNWRGGAVDSTIL